MEDSCPVIEDAWSLFEMKECKKGFPISFSEIVPFYEHSFLGLKVFSEFSQA